jgi:hypothetical protein
MPIVRHVKNVAGDIHQNQNGEVAMFITSAPMALFDQAELTHLLDYVLENARERLVKAGLK